MTFTGLRKLAGVLALFLLATPAEAQLGDIVNRAKREVEREARDAAETAVAKALFPLEEDGAELRRQSPQLDDFEPAAFADMETLARTATGGFRLKPGAWEFKSQSYCLKPGTFERAGGSGYRSGALTGKLAGPIRSILANSYAHPGVPYEDIQRLLWSMLAGVEISNMAPEAREAARVLLSDADYRALDGGALGWVPPELSSRARRELPRAARDALDATERLRRAASRPDASFGELEAIAVRSGEPPKTKDDIPAARWSWHPDGYFIRYFSNRYRETTVQILVGEDFTMARDELGRITELRFADGTYVRSSYRTDVGPHRLKKFDDIAAYAFEIVEFGSPDPATGAMRTHQYVNKGFTWVTDRAPKGAALPQLKRYASLDDGIRSDAAPYIVLAQGGFDWERARDQAERAREYRDRVRDGTRPVSDDDLDAIMDQEHYRDGLGTLRDGEGERLDWIGQTHERFARALARATEIIDSMGEDDSDPTYEPAFETGFPPGGGYVQRRGTSGRGF
ncbi:hypothetical protein [Hyphococcus sp.]|uniref:hypothetical protein n=1 Tax=Hyphococcus sp. TaxID=2038636 RepID=UPI003D12D9E4